MLGHRAAISRSCSSPARMSSWCPRITSWLARTAPCFLRNGAFSPRRPSRTRARKPQAVPSQSGFHISGPSCPFPACRPLLGMSSRFPKRRLQGVWVHLLPPATGTAAARDRDPPARLAPSRGRAWPGAERRMDVREDVPAARNHQSQGRRHYADSHGTRRQLAHFSH